METDFDFQYSNTCCQLSSATRHEVDAATDQKAKVDNQFHAHCYLFFSCHISVFDLTLQKLRENRNENQETEPLSH